MPNYLKLIISIALPLLAGAVGSLATASNIPTWYAGITKPSFSPPNWVFGPVWTTLFILMGIGLYLVWQSPSQPTKTIAMVIFGVQLVLNVYWSYCFFALHNPGLAFAEIIVLWLAIAATMVFFYLVRPLAMYLLIPYIVWVSFAAFLNYSIWRLN